MTAIRRLHDERCDRRFVAGVSRIPTPAIESSPAPDHFTCRRPRRQDLQRHVRTLRKATITAVCATYRLYAGGLIGHNYGGILKPYADQVDDATIGIVRSYAETTMNLTASGTKAAIGGLIGYSQDAEIEDCFAYAAVAVAGAVIDIGGLIGEDWYDTITAVVAKVDLVVAVTTEQTIRFGGVAGFLHADSTVTDAYRLVYSSTADTTLAGTSVSEAASAKRPGTRTNSAGRPQPSTSPP